MGKESEKEKKKNLSSTNHPKNPLNFWDLGP